MTRRPGLSICLFVSYSQYMATRKVVESDISGKTDAATFTFGVGETWYEIDLTDDEKKQLEGQLKDYMKKGRKASERPGKKKIVPDTSVEEREQIREWAKEQGYEFAPYGRIPKKIFAAYFEAHGIDPQERM